ncbi:hypothetical protein LSAT2_004898 [Lamellibrachia satsuma]|nr:hypothetical protein LSAT2_004898 [Lamellibrachia satsuma]
MYYINSLSINYCSSNRLCWSNSVKKQIQCCDYFGNNPQAYNVIGSPKGLAVENDVVYYSQSYAPSRVGSIQLKTGLYTSLNMGSYNDSYIYSMAYLHGDCSTCPGTRKGCTRMKELEVELEQLRLLIVAMVEREQMGCASGSGQGTVDEKVGEDDEKDARESSPQSWEEAERR